MDKVSLRGVEVFPFASVDQLIGYADKHKGILVAVNAEKIINANDTTREIINSNIGYCDGSGPMLALRHKGYFQACKIAGCDLWLHLISRHHSDKTFYIIGASAKIHNTAIEKLKSEYPDIKIVGHRDGYLADDNDRLQLIEDVVAKKPDIVFVAMGSPKQELLMRDMFSRYEAIYQGLGGSLDVYSGSQSRAPIWFINHHLEWLYRLIIRPKRFKREIKKIKFAWWLIKKDF